MHKPSDKILANLLFAIKEQLDISASFDLGLSLAQLAELLQYLQKEGYCTRDGGRYHLTEKGNELLSRVPPVLAKHTSLIEPSFKDKVMKVLPEDVYIPNKPPSK